MKVRITETLSRVVEAESVNEAAEKYSTSEIVLDADDFVGFMITEEKEKKMTETRMIEIPMGRYEELLRKEMGFEYRKAELNEKEAIWLSLPERIIFGVTGKTPEQPKCEDDDF